MFFIDLILRGFEIQSTICEVSDYIIFKFKKDDYNYTVKIPRDELLSLKFNKDWLNAWENRVTNEVLKNYETIWGHRF